jgi:hypothetical protein
MSCCDGCHLEKESLQAEVENLKKNLKLRPALQDPAFSLDASNLGVPGLTGDMGLYSALSSTRRSNELQKTKIQELEERIVQLQAAYGEEIGKLNILNNTQIKVIEGRDANIEKLSAQLKETRKSRANAYDKYKEWMEYSNEQSTKMEALQIEVGKITADAAQKDLTISQQGNEIELKDGITKEKDSEIAEQKAELLAKTVEISRLQANVRQMEEEQEKTRAWKNKAIGWHKGIVIGLKDAYRDDFDRLMNEQGDLEHANTAQAKEIAMLHEILYDGSTGETCSAEELKAKLKDAIEELKPTYQGEITIDELIYQVSAFSMRFNEEVRQSYLARESLRELQNYAVVAGDVVTTQHTYDRIQTLENGMDELQDENDRLAGDLEDWEDRYSKLVDHYRHEKIVRKSQIAQLEVINLNLRRSFGHHELPHPQWTAPAVDLGEFEEDKSLSGLAFGEDFRGRRSMHSPRSSRFVHQSIEIEKGPIPELDRYVCDRLGLNEISESVEAVDLPHAVMVWDDGNKTSFEQSVASRGLSTSLGDHHSSWVSGLPQASPSATIRRPTPEASPAGLRGPQEKKVSKSLPPSKAPSHGVAEILVTHSSQPKKTMATEELVERPSKRLKTSSDNVSACAFKRWGKHWMTRQVKYPASERSANEPYSSVKVALVPIISQGLPLQAPNDSETANLNGVHSDMIPANTLDLGNGEPLGPSDLPTSIASSNDPEGAAASSPRETSIPAEGSADRSSLASKPGEAEQLGKQLEEHPDEHPEEHPEEHPAQHPEEHPEEQPAEHPEEQPAEHPEVQPAEHPEEHPEEQPAEQPVVFPGALETAASIHDEATIQPPVPPPQVPAALEGHEVNFLKPCPADIQNDKTWIENGEKWTRQDVSVEVRDHIQSYITNTLEPLEKYEGKAKRKWKNDCQTNCVRSRVKNLKRCWNGKKVVKGHACDNCIKAGTTCMMITKHAMVPTILPRAPELREGLTEQDLFFWVKPRVPEIVVLDQ